MVTRVDQGADPLVPEAVGLDEAAGVVGAEGGRPVVAKVGAGQVAVEVGGEDLGVRVCADAGQGETVGAAGVADLAGRSRSPMRSRNEVRRPTPTSQAAVRRERHS